MRQETGAHGRRILTLRVDHEIGALQKGRLLKIALVRRNEAGHNSELAHKINGDGPANLARACATVSIPIIHFSIDHVFPGVKPSPYVETDATGPTGVYGRTKLSGEEGVIAAGGRPVILRISRVYDAQGKNFVRTMLRLAKTREEIGVVEDQRGRPTYAPDFADALVSVARRLVTDVSAP